jgi:hypothetical protein
MPLTRNQQIEDAKKRQKRKATKEKIIAWHIEEMYALQQKNGGKLPYRKMNDAVAGLLACDFAVTKGLLLKRLERRGKASLPLQSFNADPSLDSTILSLGVEGVEDAAAAINTKKAGRPIGTTDANSRLSNQTQKDCANSIAQEYEKN